MKEIEKINHTRWDQETEKDIQEKKSQQKKDRIQAIECRRITNKNYDS